MGDFKSFYFYFSKALENKNSTINFQQHTSFKVDTNQEEL